jgi:hemolysin III
VGTLAKDREAFGLTSDPTAASTAMPPTDAGASRRGRLREPVSGLLHLAALGFAIPATILLICRAAGKPWHVCAFAIYGASLICLFGASALYHLLPVSAANQERLRRLDHSGIHLLIAGTYTPICLVALRGGWGWSLLGVIWTLAVVGVVLETCLQKGARLVGLLLYVLMGWLALLAVGPLIRTLSVTGFEWLLAGGAVYTVGALIYARERPRLWPGRFGAHDLWHLFVIAGSVCHFIVMRDFVLPLP